MCLLALLPQIKVCATAGKLNGGDNKFPGGPYGPYPSLKARLDSTVGVPLCDMGRLCESDVEIILKREKNIEPIQSREKKFVSGCEIYLLGPA